MRVIWLDINASYSHSSLALPALHAQLTDKQSESILWHVVTGSINSDPSLLMLEISQSEPDIILSTVWLFNHRFILDLLCRYKRLNPKTVIILGGPEFFGENVDFLISNKYINAVFRGEGEESFPLLVDTLFQPEFWNTIPGMCWINENGEYIDKGEAIVSDFPGLVPPEMSRFFSCNKHFVQIETSRGCFNTCNFCVSGGGRKVQNISTSDITERLNYLCSKGVKEIRVLDRTFNANSERAEELLRVFNDFDGKLKFHLEIHPALLSENIRKRLSLTKPGLLHLEAGLQSLDNTVLNACKRVGTSEKSVDGVKFLVSLNRFELHVDLIAGLPFYTYNALVADIKYLLTLGVDEIQVELLKLLPGTDLKKNSAVYKIVCSPVPPYEVLRTSSISVHELYKVSILSKIVDIWYNNKIWRTTFIRLHNDNPTFFDAFLDFILTNNSLNNRLSQENNGILLYEFCRKFYKNSVFDVASAWIIAGFSLKKGPGKLAEPWIRGFSTENNPLYSGMDDHNAFNYYYLHCDDKKLWFALDKKDKKGKPAKIHFSN